MEQKVWDQAAPQYDEEIFDTFANDRDKVLQRTLEKVVQPHATCCDFGCGVGRTVPFLAERAREVVAVDFSAASLEIAKQNNKDRDNVRILQQDLAESKPPFCRADVGLLMQVLIMPDPQLREGILSTVHKNLRPGAHLVAVVPSLEVTLLTYQRIGQWFRRDGSSFSEAAKEMRDSAQHEVVSLAEGIVKISDTPTKHFLREEVLMTFGDARFEIVQLDKIEYSWEADFEEPPTWMQDPYPWDWLVVARKSP